MDFAFVKQWKTLEKVRKGQKTSQNMVKSVLTLEKSRLKVRNQCYLLTKNFFDYLLYV